MVIPKVRSDQSSLVLTRRNNRGYPLFPGGDNISVTSGVVSRVELTQYVHGASHLMAIQIDAAINPGNSGGPAIMDGNVVGGAFQNLPNAENIGSVMVPFHSRYLVALVL